MAWIFVINNNRSTFSGNPILDILNIDCIYEQEADSSIFIVDRNKGQINDGLKLAMFLQSEWQLYSRLVPEPVDLFRLIFKSINVQYAIMDDIPAFIGKHYKNQFCGRSMVQFNTKRSITTPTTDNVLLINLLDDNKDNLEDTNMELFQYFPNYMSNYANIDVNEDCHKLIQYNSNYFNGIPPRITVLDEIVPDFKATFKRLITKAKNLDIE